MKTAVSLFSGCGGSDAGVIKAGFNVLMANDILPYARDVYLSNHPETDYILDKIENVVHFPESQLLVGCYPCQGFSQGGVRDSSRKINYLYLEFARALKEIKPKAFVVENVSGMTRSNFKHLLNDQIKVFTELGYDVKASVLNAADYGVPQLRKRIFLVGVKKDLRIDYNFPEPTHGPSSTTLKTFVSIKDAIGDMPDWPKGEYYDSEFHWYYLSRNRRQDWADVSKTIVSNARHMPLHPISPEMVKAATDKWVFKTDAPARRFSYREAARLQGFGDLVFPETKSSSLNSKYTVVGNAVPPDLFYHVVTALPDIWD